MSIQYLDVQGITDAAITFRDKIHDFDNCVIKVKKTTRTVQSNWVGKGRNQFETQIGLMTGQLDDITEVLYDIYNALVKAETGYIDADEETAKQFYVSK